MTKGEKRKKGKKGNFDDFGRANRGWVMGNMGMTVGPSFFLKEPGGFLGVSRDFLRKEMSPNGSKWAGVEWVEWDGIKVWKGVWDKLWPT